MRASRDDERKAANVDYLLVLCSAAGTPVDTWWGRVTIPWEVGYGIGRDGGLAAVVRPMPLSLGGGARDFEIADVEPVIPAAAGRGGDEAELRGSLRGG